MQNRGHFIRIEHYLISKDTGKLTPVGNDPDNIHLATKFNSVLYFHQLISVLLLCLPSNKNRAIFWGLYTSLPKPTLIRPPSPRTAISSWAALA